MKGRLIFPAIVILIFTLMGAVNRPVFEAPEPWIDYPNADPAPIYIHDTVRVCPEVKLKK